ncbi:hypothetical protein [Ralstonia pseudosolanacearum]|uniref:hypothetical protein n=1 Tax=Ralstonia pseudosolanacearum TaxID=1310165 RepID=UPI001FFBCFEE|nr:hypothetical protein [Ralstonia pseudosolanacearum]
MMLKRKYPLEEFFRSTKPAGIGSKLIDFWEEIKTARSKKYSLAQICEWLERNDVSVTVQGLSKFIKIEEAKEWQAISLNEVRELRGRLQECVDIERALESGDSKTLEDVLESVKARSAAINDLLSKAEANFQNGATLDEQ